jgi:hypothetical protein
MDAPEGTCAGTDYLTLDIGPPEPVCEIAELQDQAVHLLERKALASDLFSPCGIIFQLLPMTPGARPNRATARSDSIGYRMLVRHGLIQR